MNFFIYIYNDLRGENDKQMIKISSDKIIISDLKEQLNQQFIFKYNCEKITFNLLISDISLKNNSLLSFYKIKSDSTLFLDIIKPINKNKEITLQKYNNIKYKYLISLGFNNSQKKNNSKEIDELIMIIKKNNFKKFESYINKNPIQYPNNNIKNGWNILHYTSYFGNSKVLEYIINTMDININKLTDNNWSALHLSIYKQNLNCISILINNKNIKTNIQINDIGTPLHLAFKMNNYKIILLLLEKCDINIKDNNNKTPFFYLKNQKLKNIILKQLKLINNEKTIKSNKNTKYKFLDILPNKKNFPPILYGVVEKTGRLLPIYRLRLIELNPYLGIIKRYKNPLDYPNNPNEIIPILEIKKCKIVEGKKSEKVFYFDIEYIDIERYKVYSKKTCQEWVNGINKSIEFCEYFHTLKKNFDNVNHFLHEFKPETYQICKETGELKKIISNDYNNDNYNKDNNKLNFNNNLNSNIFFTTNNLNGKKIRLKDFKILNIIGNGTFGKVFKVKCLLDNNIYAMKVLRKKFLLDNNQLKYALSEINILKKCSHPFIIKLHFSFQTPSNLYLIIDYCPKGDLSLLLQIKKNLNENEIKFYLSELILSIEYLHNKNILYRDLKPENILISKDNHIKLCDFGLAKENDSYNLRANSFCGSLLYISPEMLCKKGINNKGDIYSIGIIIYELFYGKTPFNGNNIDELINNILNNNINFDNNIFISEDFKSLILGILNKDENLRFDINDIKKHSFFKDVIWDDVYNKKIQPCKYNIEKYDDNNNKIFHFKDKDYNEDNINFRRIIGFSFIKSSFKEVINNENKKNEINDNKDNNNEK